MNIDNYNFNGKKAIVRVDFNVPLDENGNITDDTRIRGALPTLEKILKDGGSLIIMSHMGKPKGKVNPKFSLAQIKDAVAKALGTEVKFAEDCANAAEAAANLKPGEVLLLENLRFYPEEEESGERTTDTGVVSDVAIFIQGHIEVNANDCLFVVKYGIIDDCGLLVNSSRGIIYASQDADFAEKAGEEAKKLQQEMEHLLRENHII